MRALWSLPKAAPALLRHLAAYAELASLELVRAQREVRGQLVALAVLAISLLFALLLGCLAVIAYTWDTPHRLAAIGWMAAGFVLIAIVAALYRRNAASSREPWFGALHAEWREDRVLLDRILAAEED